jgi:hypothetical protein
LTKRRLLWFEGHISLRGTRRLDVVVAFRRLHQVVRPTPHRLSSLAGMKVWPCSVGWRVEGGDQGVFKFLCPTFDAADPRLHETLRPWAIPPKLRRHGRSRSAHRA